MEDLSWILETLPVGVWVAEVPSGEVTYVNPRFRAILGMDAVAGATIADAPAAYRIFDRAGLPYAVEKLPFSRVVATGQAAMADDLVIHRTDGRTVHLRAFAYPRSGAEGRLSHVVIAFIDITAEIEAELERQQLEARLALAINHAPIVIWAADINGVVTLSEGAVLKALGVKPGHHVGQNLFELHRDHPTLPGYIRRGLAGESFWYTLQSGKFVFDTWLTPVRDSSGSIVGVAGVSNDVSEIRALQAKAIQNDRAIALGTLAASVAHEINNPLTYVLGHQALIHETLEQLARALDPLPEPLRANCRALAEQAQKSLDPARSGAERIASITRELQTFSRPVTQQMRPVDARAAVESVLKLVGKELETRGRIELTLHQTAPVLGDFARLAQVVMNLVVNAMQAVSSGPRDTEVIAIRTGTEGGAVVIEVSDSGPGVPLEERERIFEPFVTTKDVGVGSGLGLFVCRNIVRDFSGKVSVDDRPGGGAVFRVELPALAVPAPPEPVQRGPGAAGPAHVLIVEDEYLVAEILARQLRRAGYRASIEQDPRRAIHRLAADGDTFDLIYCDLMMRKMSGMDLAEALSFKAPAQLDKIVYMTGGAFTPRARIFREDHADRCVDKPFDIVAETARRLGRPASG